MALLHLIALLASFVLVQAGSNGLVYFLETSRQNFLAESSSLEGSEFSEADIAASVAVLLGVDPPWAMSPSSASKLGRLLVPNAFHRPRRVVSLVVEGFDADYLKEKNVSQALGVMSATNRVLSIKSSKKAPKHLSGKDVRLESLNYPVSLDFDVDDLKEELQRLEISVEASGQETEEEIVTLSSGGRSIEFDLSKKSHFEFVADLLSLSAGVSRAIESHKENRDDAAELFFGTISGLKALKEVTEATEASELLLTALSKVLHLLDAASNGELVGVVSFPNSGAHHVVREMIGKHYRARTSRYLKEEVKRPQTVQLLSRRTLAASTSIILIIASLLGTWCLCYMPLLRDSLLYSGKLD